MASMVIVGSTGAFITITMPGVLLALSQGLNLAALDAARFAADFATSELSGMLVSTVLVGQSLATRYRRVVVTAALSLLVLGNIASIPLLHSGFLFGARFVCGLGEGITLAAMGAAAAALANPDRLFAIFMASNMSVATLFLLLLPGIVARWGLTALLAILSAVGALGLAALPLFPRGGKAESDAHGKSKSLVSGLVGVFSNRKAAVALLASLVFFIGIGIVWPLMGQIGTSRSVPSGEVASALAVATIGGIAAGLCVAFLGLRMGRRMPLIIGGTALVLTIAGLAINSISFAGCVVSFMFWWVFVTAFFMGAVAAADPAGRAAILIPVSQQGGLALGPTLMAFMVRNDSFGLAILAGAAACLIGLLLALYADHARKAPSTG